MAGGISNEGMLAGVCSRLAVRLSWNVWAIRAVLLILLITAPLWTALGYGLAAFGVSALERCSTAGSGVAMGTLESPELAGRKQRIADLEQRFRNWEKGLNKD